MALSRRPLALLSSFATVAALAAGVAAGPASGSESAPDAGKLVTFTAEDPKASDQYAVVRQDGSYAPVSEARAASMSTTSASAAATTVGPEAHTIYVAAFDNLGPYPQNLDTDEEIRATVQKAGSYWVRELDGLIPSFDVVQLIHLDSPKTGCGVVREMIDTANAALLPEAQGRGAHVVILTPSQCSLGPQAGSAYGSGGGIHGGGGTINVANSYTDQIVTHELGHTLGIHHANVEKCVGTGPGCPSVEYADLTSVMGLALDRRLSFPALGAVQRRIAGVEETGEVTTLTIPTTSSRTTTLTLRPRTDSSGRRTIHVKDPADGKSYFVEYRSGTGRDLGAYDGVTARGISNAKGVMVTRAGTRSTSQVQARQADGAWITSYKRGMTFRSTSGTFSMKVMSAGTTASVQVTLRSLKKLTAATPTISGTAKVGKTLTAKVGTWSPTPRVSYQWYFDGYPYPNATTSTMVLDAFLQNRKITVKVTGYRPGYVRASRTSRATAPVVR